MVKIVSAEVPQLQNGELILLIFSFNFQVALGPPGQSKLYPHLAGRKEWRAKMIEKFPNEKKAIDKYLALLKVICLVK